jgi:hypothetical protein
MNEWSQLSETARSARHVGHDEPGTYEMAFLARHLNLKSIIVIVGCPLK